MFIALIGPEAALIAGYMISHVRSRRELTRTRADLDAARRLIEYDPLTGLTNRVGARRYHQRQEAAGASLAAVLLDLDNFKAMNDTWGHHAGDAHLVAVAQRLAAACAPIGAQASRLAGDEFLLLIPHTGPAGPAVPVQVTSILAGLSMPLALHLDGGTCITTKPRASAGIALPDAGSTWADLLQRADIALYHAKAEKGRAILHTRDMRHPSPGATTSGQTLRNHAASSHRLTAA